MNSRIKHFTFITFIICFTTSTIILFDIYNHKKLSSIDEKIITNQPASYNRADYYIFNSTLQQFDKNGLLTYQITTESMTHNNKTGTTLIKPKFIAANHQNKTLFSAEAKFGKLLYNWQNIELQEDVIIRRTANKNSLSLYTHYIQILTDRHLAMTDQKITIKNKVNQLDAVGMQFYYQSGTVYLDAKVRGSHETKQ